MDVKKIVVIVEDVDSARAALLWALHNLHRCGDVITLLHVFPSPCSSRSKKKLRLLRLKGYQLALSFYEMCKTNFFNTNVEIIVAEGDQEGVKIAALVREIGASALVVGLHDHSFLYKLAMSHSGSNFNCRVLAIKPPAASAQLTTRTGAAATTPDISTNLEFSFSLIQIDRFEVPDISPPKIPYRICPDASAIIWRSRKSSRRGSFRKEARC